VADSRRSCRQAVAHSRCSRCTPCRASIQTPCRRRRSRRRRRSCTCSRRCRSRAAPGVEARETAAEGDGYHPHREAGARGAAARRRPSTSHRGEGHSQRSPGMASRPSTRSPRRRRRSHCQTNRCMCSHTLYKLREVRAGVATATAAAACARRRSSPYACRSRCNRCTPCTRSTRGRRHRRHSRRRRRTGTCRRTCQSRVGRAAAEEGAGWADSGALCDTSRRREARSRSSRCMPCTPGTRGHCRRRRSRRRRRRYTC